jgi:cytidylate kinase
MRLKLPYIDTGAMYRALTLEAMRRQTPFSDITDLVKLAKSIRIRFGPMRVMGQKVYLNGKDVTTAIRTPELTRHVVYVAREPRLRRELVAKQRSLGRTGGAVMEGRDIGTVVFPKADYKFFFDASPEVRARRRYRELLAEGKKPSLARVAREIQIRDRSDRERKEGALKIAKDARVLDTSGLTIEATVDKILDILAERS